MVLRYAVLRRGLGDESEDSQVQHCYLQSSIFAEGEGYWGTGGKIGAWPHWRSGTPGRRLTGFSPNVVVPGEAFDLQVMGVGLPFDRNLIELYHRNVFWSPSEHRTRFSRCTVKPYAGVFLTGFFSAGNSEGGGSGEASN